MSVMFQVEPELRDFLNGSQLQVIVLLQQLQEKALSAAILQTDHHHCDRYL